MIHAVVVAIIKDLAWRSAKILLKLAVACLIVMVSGCTLGRHAILIEELQPGGRARLAHIQPGEDLSLEGVTQLGAPGMIGPPSDSAMLPAPPSEQWAAMVAAVANAPCAWPAPGPVWLAAIAFYESNYGANPGPSSAGAWGYAQFMPETLTAYGLTREQALDYRVMLPQMVRYLCAGGMATNIDGALFSYNHSQAYVEHVKALAASWQTAAVAGWHDLAPFNQFAASSWANPTNFVTWAPAACSAAALDWMLTAYGHPPGLLDAAVALLIPYVGISPSVGLMDHTGAPLAAAVGRAGLTAWRQNLTDSQLRARLLQGPAMLDGRSWFGVGHWFVAIGATDQGVTIRESSGNDIRFLTWARLHGEVGWDGWSVGIATSVPSNQA